MPSNTKKSSKNVAKKKQGVHKSKNLENTPTPQQDYEHVAIVVSPLGDKRFSTQILTSNNRSITVMSHLSNGAKRMGYINPGNHVLISIRPLGNKEKKADIMYLYDADEVEHLIKSGIIFDVESAENGIEGYTFVTNSSDTTVEVDDTNINVDDL